MQTGFEDLMQPEMCELCGRIVSGSRLAASDVDGLRGHDVCDEGRCAELRSRKGGGQLRREGSVIPTLGRVRMYPSGVPDWWDYHAALDTDP